MANYTFRRDYDLDALPGSFVVNTPGRRISTKQGKAMLRHHKVANKLHKENLFKNIDSWYSKDVNDSRYTSLPNVEDGDVTNSTNFLARKPSPRLYTPPFKDDPFPNIVGKPKATQETGDTVSRTADLVRSVEQAAQYGHKPYRFQHHPFPEIIGLNDPRRRNSIAYRSALPHNQVLDILHKNAAAQGLL